MELFARNGVGYVNADDKKRFCKKVQAGLSTVYRLTRFHPIKSVVTMWLNRVTKTISISTN